MTTRILFILLLLVSLLAGCARLPALSTSSLQATWQVNQTRLKAIETWRIKGSIAITSAEEKNWNARVYWQQEGPVYQLRFNAPLGQGAMLLDGNSEQVIMHTAKNETFVARNPDTLIVQTTKLDIPVTHLYYWIRGLPAPKPILEQYYLNEDGYLHSLQQDGWKIEYLAYSQIEKTNLPKKIYLYNSQFEVNIAISQWEIEETDLSKAKQAMKEQ